MAVRRRAARDNRAAVISFPSLGHWLPPDLLHQAGGVALMALGVAWLLTLAAGPGGLVRELLQTPWVAVGWAAPLLPLGVAVMGLVLLLQEMRQEEYLSWGRVLSYAALVAALATLAGVVADRGGALGGLIAEGLATTVPRPAVAVLALGLAATSLIATFSLSLTLLGARCWRVAGGPMRALAAASCAVLDAVERRFEPSTAAQPQAETDDEDDGRAVPIRAPTPPRAAPVIRTPPSLTAATPEPAPAPPLAMDGEPRRAWQLPSVELLKSATAVTISHSELQEKARIIEARLESFGVEAQVVEISQGPTVTQFGLRPGTGVRVNRITALADDLALALSARSIRIQAPVPGHPVVGVEIPNSSTAIVTLRDLVDSGAFRQVRSKLRLCLGLDVAGEPVVADLARMPHLLIAGATGSGKSVCINTIIAGFLMQATPDDLKLILVDPKRVEMTGFKGLPHLQLPVVTDTDKVLLALKWAEGEMMRRYDLFAACSARNIEAYNRLQTGPEKKPLPYIVIIIDELADLMMAAPIEVEKVICRLAQLARATGIHLILATQRPSVDVITGLIKANFPARIAFAVSSHIDSRTILDMVGAEKLLGRGDMLYAASDSAKPSRVQGTYVSDAELEKLVQHWLLQRVFGFEPEAAEREWQRLEASADDEPTEDELLSQATRIVRETHKASTSMLQRRLKVGYSRAARLMDELEEHGVITRDGDGRGWRVATAEEDQDEGPAEEA